MHPPLSFSYSSSSSFPPSSTHPPSDVAPGWGAPYSSSKAFDLNMATFLIILVLATVLAFALHSAICLILRLYRGHHRSRSRHRPSSTLADAIPTMVFSRGTKLAGGADDAAECAICISEFVDGEQVRVLPACNHGFHVKCVEMWLLSKSSCPTCRASCLPPAAEPSAEP